jgi:hypothetical protein
MCVMRGVDWREVRGVCESVLSVVDHAEIEPGSFATLRMTTIW